MIKTTRMGQTGIRAVLDCDLEPELRLALQNQLRGYDAVEDQAQKLAEARHLKMKNTDSALEHMIEKMTRMKLGRKNRTTRAADMLIQGNTQGLISSLRDLHNYRGKDSQLMQLNHSLILLEEENIDQMKAFL